MIEFDKIRELLKDFLSKDLSKMTTEESSIYHGVVLDFLLIHREAYKKEDKSDA